MTARNIYLYIVVVVGGAVVLALEILGTRILGPFYGVSLFLWSALITVTLAALSLGYVIGGRLADRLPSLKRLSVIVAIAGLWVLFIPWLRQPVLVLTESLGLRTAVLLAASILFFLPLTLLGMITPFAIRLRAESLAVVGRTAGNFAALSTMASVVAALLTGFVLIPNVGVPTLVIALGSCLLITAMFGFLAEKRFGAAGTTAVIFVVLGFFSMGFSRDKIGDKDSGVVAVKQSPYAELRVIDLEGRRHLIIDGGIHSIVQPDTWESSHYYTTVMDIPRLYYNTPGSMLVIGLGGGSLVKNYAKKGWKIDAVEIDPAVTEIAFQYFGLDSSEAHIYHMDGRQFFHMNDRRYDLILVDAFGSSAIPFHLTTQEAFELMKSRLSEDGILAMNVEAVGWNNILVRSLAATLQQSFREVLALPMAEPPSRLGNVIIMASHRRLEALENEPERDYFDPDFRYGAGYQRVHAWDNRFVPKTAGVPILTDDLNPVDIWAESINLVARKELHEYFKRPGISW